MSIAPPEAAADSSDTGSGVLQAGRNCWRIEHAARFAMLVDADAYFRAVRAAMSEARHSIFILSWDIDSRTCLVPGGAPDGYPALLADFLSTIVKERPELQVCILNWDFAMLYALEREWMPDYRPDWHAQRRLAYVMDGRHPIGASHHQKVVVIDDAVAFVGGLDLTRCRWDTPEHAHDTALRCDADGKPYAPFHDVQALVDGDAARALGELARARWKRATKQVPVSYCHAAHDPWPADIVPDITDIQVAIARTEPAFENDPGVAEIRNLHLDAIASARRQMFFENQYFTSGLIGEALAERLAEADGPEVAIISPQTQSGWLEDATMGVLRARLDRRLKQADRYHHYRLYSPRIPGLDRGCLNVHSKVFAIDDDLFSIGSANLSNRSMTSDTECNLVIEARGGEAEKSRIRDAIAGMRNRLLGEHLAVTPQTVAAEFLRGRKLHAVIEALQQPGRSLQVLELTLNPELDALIPKQALFDPERPIDPDEMVAQLVPKEARRPVPWRLIGLGMLGVMLALLAIAWRWTPLREFVNLASLLDLARSLEALPFTPVAIVFSYVAAGLLMIPVTLLIAVTGIVFGPVTGAFYAVGGSLLSAAVTYALGRWLGRDAVRRMLGVRINRLSRRIAKRGILAMVVVRLLPIAPFTVVNVVAGASQISFRDYMLGTLLGMSPGIVITVTFVHNLAEAVRNPSAGTVSILAGLVLLVIGFALLLQRLFSGKKNQEAH